MKENIKKSVKSILIFIVNLTGRTRVGRYLETLLIQSAMERAVRIIYKSVPLIFSSPNALSKWRYETFASKEPETLEWIDEIPPGSVLWDIGANLGLHSV